MLNLHKLKLLFTLTLIFSVLPSAFSATELVVYTSIENDLLNEYKTRFEKANPDIEIKWVRDSTGVITAKLLAEKEAPKADAIIGVGASSLLILKNDNLLETYKPKGYELLSENMRDNSPEVTWVGMNAWTTSLCVNKYEMKKRNLPYPKTWQDLTNPIYKGQIATPNPASSGSGYMNMTAWLKLFGDKQGWKYMDDLHTNIKMYTHSGTKPCSMAAQGEVAIGLSSSSFARELLKRKAPIDLVIPEGGVGWEMEAAAIPKGTKQLAAAQKLMDWMTSDDVAEIGQNFSGITARPEFMTEDGKKNFDAMVDVDLQWSADHRSELLQAWSARYEANQ